MGIIYLYVPNNHSDGVAFFETIIAFVQSWESNDFLIFEDFNFVMHVDEKRGVNGVGGAFEKLINFIDSLYLHNMPL